jgi:6-bladed beta-propeller
MKNLRSIPGKSVVILLALALCIPVISRAGFLRKKAKETPQELVVYPSPPDTARFQYLRTINSSEYFGQRTGFAAFIMGKEPVMPIGKPYGISVRNGILYICDPVITGLEKFNFATRKFSTFIPGGLGRLRSPLTCFVDSDEHMFVADPGRKDVVEFDKQENFVARYGDTGAFKPTEVLVYKNRVWVTNPGSHTINIYDHATHDLVEHFPRAYEAGDDGFLYSPYNFTITDDEVYVTDFGDFKIKIFDHAGKFLRSVGSYGTNIGQFVRPKGIAVDREQNLFVVDAGFENVQIFNKESQLLMFFGGSYKGPGDMWLPAKVVIDYDHNKYFEKYVDKHFDLKYLVFVSNQYGPDKINVYGAVTPKK